MGTTAATTAWTPDALDDPRDLADLLDPFSTGDPRTPRVITAVGAGGKTTLLHSLADAHAARGAAVVLTTTTHMSREAGLATSLGEALAALKPGRVVLAGVPVGDDKFTGLGSDGLERLRAAADVLLVEGDGSRRQPFKVPAGHEPVVPEATDLLLVVAGFSALGRPLAEVCCRVDVACALLGLSPDTILDAPTAAALLRAGYLDHPALARWRGRRVIVLNQADDASRRRQGCALADLLPGEPVLLTCTPDAVGVHEGDKP